VQALIQRVTEASVCVEGRVAGEIGRGILLLLGIEKGDGLATVESMAQRVASYRIFPDEKGHMNLSLTDIQGAMLVVSQFTLAANTRKGLRPSFSSAALPKDAEALYEAFVVAARKYCANVQTGVFGGDMKVSLVNDGPVTFLLSGARQGSDA